MIAQWVETVRSDDPDRFLAIMAAPPVMRERLFVLAAFNLELARLAWVSQTPLIVQMRLVWWHNVVAGEAAASDPLAKAVLALNLDRQSLERMILARSLDQERVPFESAEGLWAYLADTSGCLMRLGSATPAPELEAIGAAHGLVNWLRAVPSLTARGHQPLPDMSEKAIAQLAQDGLSRLGPVARENFVVSLPAWQTRHFLEQVKAAPQDVREGRLYTSEFTRRSTLLWRSWRGRWPKA